MTNTRPMFVLPQTEDPVPARVDGRSITSGPVANRAIGAPVRATDQENDRLYYAIRGKYADIFRIDSRTGQLRTWQALDHLERESYTVSVSVHDGFDAYYRPSRSVDDTISVIITVLPPPPPTI